MRSTSHRFAASLVIIAFLFAMPVASAQLVVLDTQLNLSSDENWKAELHVDRGELNVTLTKQAVVAINLTIMQENNTRLVLPMSEEESSISQLIIVEEGRIQLSVKPIGISFTDITLNILITQEEAINRLFVAGVILIILALPFTYILGRYRGKQ